jgi:hypothetical protein
MAHLKVAGNAMARQIVSLETVGSFSGELSSIVFWAEITLVIEHHLVSKSEHNSLERDLFSSGKTQQIFLKTMIRFRPSSHTLCSCFHAQPSWKDGLSTKNNAWGDD